MAILLFSFSVLTVLTLGIALFSGNEFDQAPTGNVLSATDEIVIDVEEGQDPTLNEELDVEEEMQDEE